MYAGFRDFRALVARKKSRCKLIGNRFVIPHNTIPSNVSKQQNDTKVEYISNMKFKCKEIAINDEELGCQVTFSEKKDLREETANMSVQALIDSIGRYLLLQR